MIRKMETTDIDAVVKFMYESSLFDYADKKADTETMYNNLHNLKDISITLVYESKDKSIGFIWILLIPAFLNSKRTKAMEVCWYPLPTLSKLKQAEITIKLHKKAEKILLEKKIESICMSVNPKNSLKNYLGRNGYVLKEYCYEKEAM